MVMGLDLFILIVFGWFVANLTLSISLDLGVRILISMHGDKKSVGQLLFGLRCLGFFGVATHEFGHWMMCKAWKVEVVEANILSWDDGFHGRITTKRHGNFVASLFIVIGPIITTSICTAILWIYYGFLGISAVDTALKVLVIILLISSILGQLPSRQDWRTLGNAFSENHNAGIWSALLIASFTGVFFFLVPIINYLLATVLCFLPTIIGLLVVAKKCEPSPAKVGFKENKEKKTEDQELEHFLNSSRININDFNDENLDIYD